MVRVERCCSVSKRSWLLGVRPWLKLIVGQDEGWRKATYALLRDPLLMSAEGVMRMLREQRERQGS